MKITLLIRKLKTADEIKKVLIPRGQDATKSSGHQNIHQKNMQCSLHPLAVPKLFVTE
jgi:hypothetical protein